MQYQFSSAFPTVKGLFLLINVKQLEDLLKIKVLVYYTIVLTVGDFFSLKTVQKCQMGGKGEFFQNVWIHLTICQ